MYMEASAINTLMHSIYSTLPCPKVSNRHKLLCIYTCGLEIDTCIQLALHIIVHPWCI